MRAQYCHYGDGPPPPLGIDGLFWTNQIKMTRLCTKLHEYFIVYLIYLSVISEKRRVSMSDFNHGLYF